MSIRTAILGYGRSGGTLHAGAIERNSAFTLVAACDTDPTRREKASVRFACAVYEDYHEMLRQEALDLVVIVTRSDQHRAMTCDCLQAGVDVLVTKPWAVNAAEAADMIQAAQASGKRLLPWLPARWGSDLRRLRELLEASAIGRVFMLRRAVTSFGTRCDWQTQRQCGGGYLLNWGPHLVDPPILLMGSPVRSVYARLKQVINPGDTEDLFLAVLTLENGVTLQIDYTIALDDLPSWFIQGDRGTIVMRGKHLKVSRNTPAQPSDPTQFATMKSADQKTVEETIEGSLYGDEHEIYREIAAALRGEAAYPVTPASALELSRVLDAIRQSDAENRVIELR